MELLVRLFISEAHVAFLKTLLVHLNNGNTEHARDLTQDLMGMHTRHLERTKHLLALRESPKNDEEDDRDTRVNLDDC